MQKTKPHRESPLMLFAPSILTVVITWLNSLG